MRKRLIGILIAILVLISIPINVLAQEYYFQLTRLDVHVFWNDDGTQSIDYTFFFQNDPSGHSIEYVDVGLPTSSFNINSISAEANGNPLTFISSDEFLGDSDGVAIGLGNHSIPPGESGTVHVFIGEVRNVLYPDDDDENYVSAVFSPAYFENDVSYGNTELTVTFHLPAGVQPEEPRWHSAPDGFPSEPEAGFDEQGRIYYRWNNPNANPYTRYQFGASFPKEYIPDDAIVRQSVGSFISRINFGAIMPCLCVSAFLLIIVSSVFTSRNRRMQYLPPKVAIEGHGIKRGLTAVEAAILLEQPLDKILTMILFAVVKKNAAKVVKKDPLELEIGDPLPKGLHQYEQDFIRAFQKTGSGRRKELQDTIVDLVKGVSKKMKGFSRKETIAYYRDIVDRAWDQVETAETPEVRSEAYDKVMEWTMLDKNYDDRTREIFRHGPVIIPTWWGRYDPTYTGPSAPKTFSAPTQRGAPSTGGPAMPQLPGSTFAASVVGGVQNFASNVVGNITDFTGRVTQQTNPVPKSSSKSWTSSGRSGGSGCACACACACAGCACACAGGGR